MYIRLIMLMCFCNQELTLRHLGPFPACTGFRPMLAIDHSHLNDRTDATDQGICVGEISNGSKVMTSDDKSVRRRGADDVYPAFQQVSQQ